MLKYLVQFAYISLSPTLRPDFVMRGRVEEEKAKEEAKSKKKDILAGNQLLLGDQALKRKWDDDTVCYAKDRDNYSFSSDVLQV